MMDQAVARLNRGDVSALDDFWDENADYVGVDGTLIKGRAQMRGFFRKMGESSTGHQIASVEQIRFRPTFSPHSSRYWTSSRRASVARAHVVVLMGHPVSRNANVLNQKRFLIAPSFRFVTEWSVFFQPIDAPRFGLLPDVASDHNRGLDPPESPVNTSRLY